MKTKTFILLAAVIAALVVAGCGDDNKTEDSADTGDTTELATEETGATESSGEAGDPPKVTGSLDEKPEIATPEGSPPTELIIKDIKKGKGPKAKDGDTVKVQYVGMNWSNGQEFDTSWSRGEPFEFTLGQGMVIQGWDEGVAGMKKGGRRLLVIPPEQGYGAQGSPPSIPANETLVFVVDLEDIE